MEVKEDSEKAGLKSNIQKTKIMTSGPITSGQIDGETMETVTDFIFLFSKITADGDCSHEIKRSEEHTSELQSPTAVILEPKKRNSVTVSIVSPSICHEVMGPDAMIFVYLLGNSYWDWNFSVKEHANICSFY